MSNRIYLISGLGADRRAFKKLVFPPDVELVYLDWIAPISNETLEEYALRLASGIDTAAPFYLVGLSFGGMIATEIAKNLNPVHTFLISSTPVYKQLPWYYRMAGSLGLQKMVPVSLIKNGNNIGLKFLGAETHDERVLLKQLVTDSDPAFIKWALSCILKWRNTEQPTNLTHIHGTADRILPIRYYKPDIIVKNGGHFMVYANAEEISEAIKVVMLSDNKTKAELIFDKMVKECFHQTLKPVGFKKRGNNFYLQLKDLGQIINIQKSMSSTKTDISFTINIGIFIPEYYLGYYSYATEIPVYPTESDCAVRRRIGELRGESDKWYSINTNTNEQDLFTEMQENINDFILPFFAKTSTRALFIDTLDTSSLPLPPLGKLMLYAQLKEFEKAKKEYEVVVQNNQNIRILNDAKELMARYGLD